MTMTGNNVRRFIGPCSNMGKFVPPVVAVFIWGVTGVRGCCLPGPSRRPR